MRQLQQGSFHVDMRMVSLSNTSEVLPKLNALLTRQKYRLDEPMELKIILDMGAINNRKVIELMVCSMFNSLKMI